MVDLGTQARPCASIQPIVFPKLFRFEKALCMCDTSACTGPAEGSAGRVMAAPPIQSAKPAVTKRSVCLRGRSHASARLMAAAKVPSGLSRALSCAAASSPVTMAPSKKPGHEEEFSVPALTGGRRGGDEGWGGGSGLERCGRCESLQWCCSLCRRPRKPGREASEGGPVAPLAHQCTRPQGLK